MSKELTPSPLETLEHLKETLFDISIGIYQKVAEDISCIETALKDYDKLFKMFPCEETTARQILIVLTQLGIKDSDTLLEKLKALEVIIEKDVNPVDIRCCDTVEQYNVKENGNIPLTQEEFDLLRRYCHE